jgi:hypothetical protein
MMTPCDYARALGDIFNPLHRIGTHISDPPMI